MREKDRLHFGVLFSTIDNTCQCRIWDGIVEYSKINDIHLTAYMGTYQTRDNVFESHYETCFETIKDNNSLDGVILFSGFIAEDIGIDNFRGYVERIQKNLPLVSVSFPMSDVPSVLVDNENGIFDTVEHLIKRHSKKNIAFVKGPEGHPEAEARLAGYKKALEANGIKFDKNYVLPGHFSFESGKEAIADLIDNRGIPFDAVVASDDETATGVLEELDNRNILVPTIVSVTGFDDDRASSTYIPSISTARQPFFEIGTVSAEMLYKQIQGIPVRDVEYVPPIFVARQSCGCLEKSILISQAKVESINEVGSIYSFVLRKLISLFPRNVPGQRVHSWITALVEKLKQDPFPKDEFLHLFNEILVNYKHYSQDFSTWHEALNVLFMGVELHKTEVANVHSVLSALNSASALVHDVRLKEEKSVELALSDVQLLIRRVTSKLVLTFEIDALCEELQRSLPDLSIHTAIVGLFRNPIRSIDVSADRNIYTVIGFDEDKKFNIKHNNANPMSFSDYSTIAGFNFEQDRRAFFFIPLFFKDEELGAILLPYNTVNPIDVYETLRVNISTAVKGADLLSKVKVLSITDDLTGLLNRRGFFQFAHSRIQHLSRRTELKPLVLFMDMDGLKMINDNYGHKEGDTAISAFAKILKETLREEDIIGRMGGDEFVVFSSVKTEDNSRDLVKRIRAKFKEYNDKKLHPYIVSCSVGCVVLEKATKESFEAAMLSADSVLYTEKMEKKNKGLSRM
jgi:diguanylate cyclase (GGDEF)-like protein